MLKNGSFTEGWTDVSANVGFLINQQPNGWTLRWLQPGEPLFGSNDVVQGVPECVHKLATQLPANEQRGAANALILEGDTTYKIFSAGASFGAELKQTVTGLKPGSAARLTVPVLAVLHGETDAFGAESGAWANDAGEWANAERMGNRRWYKHVVDFTVPESGTAEITIRVKSKWPRPKDFFIDGVKLEAQTALPGTEEPTTASRIVQVRVPQGMEVVTAVGTRPNVIVITAPQDVTVETLA